MIFYLRFSLAFLLAGLIAAQAYGQFPRSGERNAAQPSQKTGSISWKSDLPEALKLAREQRKLVFLHFSGTHCPPCRKLEDNVLNRNDVAITMLSRYVPVFIVVEQSQDLVERFHVQAWPTDVILDPEGREIARQVSPQNPQEFVKRLSMVAAKHHAGQSATIANVRAAVAADVTEASAPVQQTAADDRPPAQSPRAESKIVTNPHVKEGRLPPIVARNAKTKVDVPEDEGFSPPNKRRKPPIVRKAREKEEEAVVVAPDEPSIDEESTDTNVAPWRKTAQAKKPAEPKETVEQEQVAESKTEVETDAAAQEAAEKQSNEPAPDEPAQDEPAEKADELKSTEAKPEDSQEKAEAIEKAAEPEVTDELPKPRSRFGAIESTEKPIEVDAPVQESTEEVPNQTGEETGDKSELPKEDEKPVEAEAKKTNEQEQEPEAETTESPRPKSRFSGTEESPSEPMAEDAKSPPAEKAAEQPEESQPEAVTEPEVKQDVAGNAGETKATEEVDESKTEGEKALQNQPAEKVEVADGEESEFEKKYQEARPKEETKKSPAKTVAPKKSKKAEDPPQESAVAEEQPETEKSLRPRGLAKIARSGKYVLGGYCCVTLLESETLKKGNPQFGAIHRGRIFLFSSAEARKKFLENPDDYSPMLTGYDPVLFADSGELVDGSAEILAKLHDGRVVTFSSEETYKKFAVDYKKSREKSTYVEAVRAAMKETNGGRHFR